VKKYCGTNICTNFIQIFSLFYKKSFSMPKSLSKTPAPKKDRIFGSDKNKKGSASSKASAKGIELNDSIVETLTNKAKEYNEKHPNSKVSVTTLKAVMRRGMGAYSTSHRPTITGGAPNSRQAWGFARVNKFLKKKAGQQVKAAYVQDDDLMAKGGQTGQAITCVNCGWHWNTSDSEEFDKYICHKCGFDNRTFYDPEPIGVMADGGLIAPNGKPSNLTPEQYKLVRTPEFKAWFGDWENDPENASKVVDENGEPLVVYHGTYVKEKFNNFDFNKADLGFHFGTYEQANDRSQTKIGIKDYKQFIEPFFLNIRKLFVINDAIEFEYPQTYIGDLLQRNIITEKDINENGLKGLTIKQSNEIIRNLLVEKYNNVGFKYQNQIEAAGNSYIVCEPNQIKLADGTNTTFDAANPDIRYADGGELDYTKDALEFFKKELGIKSDVVLVQSKSSFNPISMSQLMGGVPLNSVKNNKFHVLVDFDLNKNRFIRTLAHELVHVKQMEDERLRFEDNKIIFDDEKMTYDEYQKRYHSDDIPKFEDEAFNLERVLQNKYAEKEGSYADGGQTTQELFKPSKTIEQIAKEKDVPLDYAEEQLRKGMKTESEHSDNPMVQETIALQHLDEMIDYYEKLEYIENQNKMAEGDLLNKSLFNKALIYKSIKPIREANEIMERLDYMESQNKMANGGVTKFYKEYLDWYIDGVYDKMTIMVSVPNALSKMSGGDNDVILDVFEKKDESVNAKEKMKELLEIVDRNGLDIYLEPIPRLYNIKDKSKRDKITKEYLIKYYENFGFELLSNGLMVRVYTKK
jgi:hypothetical protein